MMRFCFSAFALLALLLPVGAAAQTLQSVKDNGVLKLGFRDDAAPYSHINEAGVPAGYSISLCGAVASHLQNQLGLADLKIEFVTVGAEDRFDAVASGKIDLLCGATTATLSRREKVDFSVSTFIDGASVMTQTDGPQTFEALAGHKIGVRAGTTTEEALGKILKKLSIDAEVVPVASHDDGLAAVDGGTVSAYFADQAILLFLAAKSPNPSALRISKKFLTHEPYALALTRGDDDFRLAVDRALSHIYRSGQIVKIFKENFVFAQPSDLLQALYLVSALPD